MNVDPSWIEEAINQAEKSWGRGWHTNRFCAWLMGMGRLFPGVTMSGFRSGDPTAHAEVVCFRNAGRRRDWNQLILVSTLSPCIMCTGTTLLFGLKRVIIGENKTFLGAEDLMCSNGVQVTVLQDTRCIELMQRFQQEKPDLWSEDIGQ